MKSLKINTHTMITIPFDLDVVKAEQIISSDGKVVFYKDPESPHEGCIRGYQMIAYMDGRPLEAIMFKNGKDGWAEVLGDKADAKMIKGNIEARAILPKLSTVYISDFELNKA